MSRRALPWIAVVLSITSCDPETVPPPPEQKCCEGVEGRQKRESCKTGEVSVPFARCEMVDAGLTCGDGQYQPALEACDPSAAAAPACSVGECVECSCRSETETCGDGQITGSEVCERRADCQAGEACRSCLCRSLTDVIEFRDTVGDTPATARGVTISAVTIRLGTPQGDVLRVSTRFIDGPPDRNVEVCFVVVVAQGDEQRLCMRRSAVGDQDITFADRTHPMRVLTGAEAVSGGPLGGEAEVSVAASVGLRIEQALSFYVESLYDGQRTDALPDTGALPFTEVFGK